MKIGIVDAIKRGLELVGLRRPSRLRIVPMEGVIGIDSPEGRRLATQTTNLIMMDLDPEGYLRRLRAKTEKK